MPLLEAENMAMQAEPEWIDVQGYLFREASSEAGD